ncbi:ABC transporter ATP-binding protein [Defluviitoga tunisiensis]|jgi:peptide/nickel transport system ATP-binding protein|uniref:BC-type dipeptide/oligopeptide/nickel transport system, ATPase component n=1 Tax=Defluviitoga tunisiensis TaxID=1006576 RepID=A0A0C7NIG8_DEFTU|nr:ABC transporter ATP-binding protein [Defluviitoga tunisiensis]CEP77746.1 BC-type dipeptide/oligopeptide/nickel transport system, ATPase component [Defluviitoga tunisiensis]HPZ74817.1 ABC transporter ATP-binding protein [Candidatus Pacearchaeota archaeon]
MSLLEIYEISAYYVHNNSTTKAVDNVSFSVEENEIFGIAGESGCGKSTLVKTIYGFIEPPLYLDKGKIIYNFKDSNEINSVTKKNISSNWWKKISYIPQGSMNVLNPVRRIKKFFRNLWKAHSMNLSYEKYYNLVISHLHHLGLPADILEYYPHQLSGGMKQRVVIAAASLFHPELIVADEPTSALDVGVQLDVLRLLIKIQNEYKNTIIIVAHDMSVMANFCSRIAIMYAGNIVEVAETKALFKNPLHPYTKLLIDSLPKIGDIRELKAIPGSPPDLTSPPSGCKFHPRCHFAKNICIKEEPNLKKITIDHAVACHLLER